jgi:hypothetical protein
LLIAGRGPRADSPVSSTDDALARANGFPALLPQDNATSKGNLPKSLSTSHLGAPMVRRLGPKLHLVCISFCILFILQMSWERLFCASVRLMIKAREGVVNGFHTSS